MRVALVHDWLTGLRGGERCLEAMCELFPEADLFTLLHTTRDLPSVITQRRIVTSFLQRLPAVGRYYRYLLPLFPLAAESLDLRGYDLVLSSSHAVARGVITDPRACHIAYVHTPMRYVWEAGADYFGPERLGRAARAAALLVQSYLRLWETSTASRPDFLIANSRNVALRIWKRYRRHAEVIHPPVDIDRFQILPEVGAHFAVVSALVPYKRIDLAIDVANRLGFPLEIVGAGHEQSRLARCAGPTVRFHGYVAEDTVPRIVGSARALLFPGEDDFGIAPVEAMAAGRPVIALARGGALETVVPIDHEDRAATGVLFDDPSVASLTGAIRCFEACERRFEPAAIRAHALGFRAELFRARLFTHIETCLATHRAMLHDRFSGPSLRVDALSARS
ncbi:MAG: glycosyltransferase [Deltaproteobacteria bacterium]|nr:glycosyltransferase [Deltaproteobacteria bacterium]